MSTRRTRAARARVAIGTRRAWRGGPCSTTSTCPRAAAWPSRATRPSGARSCGRSRASGGSRLLLFSLVDEHHHEVIDVERPAVFVQGMARAFRAVRPDLRLAPAHWKPVDDRRYLRWLVRYLLTQPEHHGLGVPSALWTGGCFLDLVGARVLPGFSHVPLREQLLRLQQRELLEIVGLEQVPVEPATEDALFRAGPARLVELAATVHVVGPALIGRSAPVVAARALAVRAAREATLPIGTLTRVLGCGLRQVQRLAHVPVEPRAILALRRLVSLEQRIAQVIS